MKSKQNNNAIRCAIIFAWGIYKDDEILSPNTFLSLIACKESKYWLEIGHRYPIYTQRDITIPTEQYNGGVEYIEQASLNKPPSSYAIAAGAVEWMIENGYEKADIYAAPPHMKRCLRDMENAARERNLNISLFPSRRLSELELAWFSKESKQLRTQWRIVWIIRETMLRIMPWWLYKKITA